ncbi:MAG: trehalase family glycosidase [Terriglobia bacterium]
MSKRAISAAAISIAFFVFLAGSAIPVRAAQIPIQPVRATLSYISSAWTTLTRSMHQCATLYDPKNPGASVIYFPADFPVPNDIHQLQKSCRFRIQHLPEVIHDLGEINVRALQPPGLLYLPHPYVVPGGMFNEMYGWDSYFILRGLLQAGKLDLARGMTENFFFEIAHYGAILNSNRTYHLTRSQPPFLSEMVRDVYEAEKARGSDDRAWLREAYPFVVRTENFWTHPPNLAGATGLSRYFDFGNGPTPELGTSSNEYYRRAAGYFVAHPEVAKGYLIWMRGSVSQPHLGSIFPVYLCSPGAPRAEAPASRSGCKRAGAVALSAAFYKGDRSIRESGFDITFKFGPFGDGTPDYAAVGLNSLLYREERELEWMSAELGRKAEASRWQKVAERREKAITKYFWNAQRGLYFDYNFKTGKQSRYVYATTFYPLWAGAASKAQAIAVIANQKRFEEPGGIVMSRKTTGGQWDYPYGWAPIQLITVEGLRRYGDDADANRISADFLSMVAQNFVRHHTMFEKYNVVTRSSETNVSVGYTRNQVGFGWTNGVFLTLYDELPASWQAARAQTF